jgi:hypothetical protein
LSVEVGGVTITEDERPGVVGAGDDCELVVVPIGVADVDVAAVVDEIVVAVIGALAAVQVATGRLVQLHIIARRVSQSCGFR